ncbi:MAG: amidohydrolase family protein, partial [Emticicia sp.]|uniref:amidohydrolase family protein n=1 Tax=Emticicia sp. TaxID=1930953 RepID=UPI003BA4BBC6
MKKLAFTVGAMLTISSLQAQQIKIGDNAGTVTFEEYEPKSTLVVPGKPITRAKFPFIDVHNHQWEMNSKENLTKLITEMDKMNMGLMVNLSGRGFNQDEAKSTAGLTGMIGAVKENYPTRFAVFTNIDFSKISEPDWTAKAVKTLEEDVKLRGAKGLKIYKSLGFSVKDNGKLVPVDDARIDPIWAKAGELG